MTNWLSFAKEFGRRLKAIPGQFAVSSAYQRVFLGNPSRADQERVLAHFAAACGWNQITAPGVASEQLWFQEGKRAAFGELFAHLSLSQEDLKALENAARHEVALNTDNAT